MKSKELMELLLTRENSLAITGYIQWWLLMGQLLLFVSRLAKTQKDSVELGNMLARWTAISPLGEEDGLGGARQEAGG